jgi:hypothetical protein
MERMECHQKRTKHEHHIRNEVFFFGNNDLGHRPFSPFSSLKLNISSWSCRTARPIQRNKSHCNSKENKTLIRKQIGFAGQPTTASFDFPQRRARIFRDRKKFTNKSSMSKLKILKARNIFV